MNHLQDKQFEKLNAAASLSTESKNKMKHAILTSIQRKKNYRFTKTIGAIITIFLFAITYSIVVNGNKDMAGKVTTEVITDSQTPETLPRVPLVEDMYTIEWRQDSMDRGNHDLVTSFHGSLVVSNTIQPIKRGDILYYEMQQQEQIGRVVGLPGETVEIREGQVYINDKKLQTFYGTAKSYGLTKDEYFEKIDKRNINEEGMKEYFNTTMAPVFVEKNTVFLLVDTWWRGFDSKEFGTIPFEQLRGKVVGYQE